MNMEVFELDKGMPERSVTPCLQSAEYRNSSSQSCSLKNQGVLPEQPGIHAFSSSLLQGNGNANVTKNFTGPTDIAQMSDEESTCLKVSLM